MSTAGSQSCRLTRESATAVAGVRSADSSNARESDNIRSRTLLKLLVYMENPREVVFACHAFAGGHCPPRHASAVPAGTCHSDNMIAEVATSPRQNGAPPAGERSVLGDRGVHVLAPAENAAREVPHAMKSGRPELAHGLRTSDTAATMHDEVARAVQGRERVSQLGEGNEPRAGNAGNVPFVRLAHIYEVHLFACLAPLQELVWRDLREFPVQSRRRDGLGHAAE